MRLSAKGKVSTGGAVSHASGRCDKCGFPPLQGRARLTLCLTRKHCFHASEDKQLSLEVHACTVKAIITVRQLVNGSRH